MIRVCVLERMTTHDNRFIDLPFQGQKIESVVETLGVNRNEIGMIVANGKPARLTDLVEDACEIYILPVLEGG